MVTDGMVERACIAAYNAMDMGNFPAEAVSPDADRAFVRAALESIEAQGEEAGSRVPLAGWNVERVPGNGRTISIVSPGGQEFWLSDNHSEVLREFFGEYIAAETSRPEWANVPATVEECDTMEDAIMLAERAIWTDDEGVLWVPSASWQRAITEIQVLESKLYPIASPITATREGDAITDAELADIIQDETGCADSDSVRAAFAVRPALSPPPAADLYRHLLDMLGAKDHEDAGRIIGELHARVDGEGDEESVTVSRENFRKMLAAYRREQAGETAAPGDLDSRRLDYIERTFSGMTNRERYLPVQMIWGKGANGRTLREACDKYMQREEAGK